MRFFKKDQKARELAESRGLFERFRDARSIRPGDQKQGQRTLLIDSGSPALAWWDQKRNDPASLQTATTRASRSAHWVCPECGRRFTEQVFRMAGSPSCPACSARRRKKRDREWERWMRTPASTVPALASAWADESHDAATVMVADQRQYVFRCPRGHRPRVRPFSYLKDGCQFCRAARTREHPRWLADVSPEIASQWHPTRNGQYTPHNVVWNSTRKVWWRSECCGHEWRESPKFRDKYERLRCPACRSVLGSLAWVNPKLASEWSPANPSSAWHFRPHANPGFVPEWICASNPAHVWKAPLSSRSYGSGCPECHPTGQSRVELEYHRAVGKALGKARSGAVLRDPAFAARRSWTADITVTLDGQTVVIEYDGAYWHESRAKQLVDERKSRDFLAAGYVVVRLREDPLPMLNIKHPRLLQIRVYPTASRPKKVVAQIADWLAAAPGHRGKRAA